jgi:hypothetical protein
MAKYDYIRNFILLLIYNIIQKEAISMSNYCDVLNSATLNLGGGEQARAEKIVLKSNNQQELRFSWRTQNGVQFQRAPLDLPEDEWVQLFDVAVQNNIVSDKFIKDLIKVLVKGLK